MAIDSRPQRLPGKAHDEPVELVRSGARFSHRLGDGLRIRPRDLDAEHLAAHVRGVLHVEPDDGELFAEHPLATGSERGAASAGVGEIQFPVCRGTSNNDFGLGIGIHSMTIHRMMYAEQERVDHAR